MMRPLSREERLKLATAPVAQPTSLIAPIGGWNTRDALDAMEEDDAVQLDNFYPDAGGVNIRQGYASYASSVGAGPVKTLAEYNAGSTRKFLAGASGALYDISASGVAGAPLASGFLSDQWQSANFLSKLFLANGLDSLQVFDGAAIAASTFTGVTLSTLIGVAVYQQRLFFWQSNSTGFWYAGLNSISGALLFYDLSVFSPRGGNLIAVTALSHDGGNGVQDVIAFILSSGDVLLFFGNDPGNPNVWTMIGRYRISPPVSPRAVCQYGAEAFLTTFDDHVPLQQQLVALKLGQLPPRSKVSTAVQAAVIANQSAFGWQALYYPAGRRLIFNVPNPDGTFDQHVQNTGVPKQPWCRFKNMNAYCWGLFKDVLYFGLAGGLVYQADTGNTDLTAPISATGQQAWNSFASPSRKSVTAVRPVVQTFQSGTFTFGLGFDYGAINVTIAASTSGSGSPWDTSPWDTSPWSTETIVNPRWSAAGGSGTAVSIRMTAATVEAMSWLRTDLRFEKGRAL